MDGEIVNKEYEKQLKNEMLFTLSERESGTLAIVVTANEKQRKDIYRFLKDHLHEYNFYDLDLTPYHYTSLFKALQERLPAKILKSSPVEFLVNITGLEHSVYKTSDGKVEYSELIAQLNFERELLFRQPFIVILWIGRDFDNELRKKAPDFMHWLSKRFVFDEEVENLEVAEKAISYGEVQKRGKIPERLERIKQLEATWERLSLHYEDRARIIKDKIGLLLLLGKEFRDAFRFAEAEESLKKAIALNDKIDAGMEGQLFFELATLYLAYSKHSLALECYNKVLEFSIGDANLVAVFHQIGIVYWEQHRWKQALEYFKKVLVLKQTIGDTYTLGDSYHMIGMVYAQQRLWTQALSNYQMALESYKQVGNDEDLGGTYHQIGMVYSAQRDWERALFNFQRALELKKKIGDEYAFGSTYHELGSVYMEQQQWAKSLRNYRLALRWKEKTGNDYDLASTYHQIGMVYAEQRKWSKSLENYQKALAWRKKVGNEYKSGHTYHQIGMVYQKQQLWEKAVANYKKAQQLYKRADDEYELGGTYHQMGMVYEDQKQWQKSLRNYRKALQWKEKTENLYDIGSTYHQIGIVYEEQGKWAKSLENYKKALEWKEKVGNVYTLGNTYFRVGVLYGKQEDYLNAKINLEKAVIYYSQQNHPLLQRVVDLLNRMKEIMAKGDSLGDAETLFPS
ncbi:MAG TPA: tetratricopeptide repeat protein [Chitinophagaceae bacterium]|nr:tetratricopeptide repeat protein [Chitinophagaceae bacterium]